MDIQIRDIPERQMDDAVKIFTEAFAGDPLFLFAFPEEITRIKQTRIMYEFVVLDMVPLLNLRLAGAFISTNELAGCIVYSPPERREWGEHMTQAITKMRNKAGDERIDLIGEFAVLEGFELVGPYFYGNELAVKKELRGKGIGRALTEHLINECNKHPSAKGIAIDTANNENISMYEKWGWELKAIRDFYSIKKYFMWRAK